MFTLYDNRNDVIILRYDGIACAACGVPFTDKDEVVVCPRCGAPEHRECWLRAGACVNDALHAGGFVWQSPAFNERPSAAQINGAGAERDGGPELRQDFEMNGMGGEPISGGDVFNGCGPPERRRAYSDARQESSGPDLHIDGIPAAETAAYVRQNAGYYIGEFADMDSKQSNKSWNWAAFLFDANWLFYRKMYKYGVVAMIIISLTSTLTSRVFYNTQTGRDIASKMAEAEEKIAAEDVIFDELIEYYELFMLSSVISMSTSLPALIGVGLYFGFNGNALYRKKIKNDILAAREQADNMGGYLRLLSRKGGGSAGAVLLSFLVHMTVSIVIEAIF